MQNLQDGATNLYGKVKEAVHRQKPYIDQGIGAVQSTATTLYSRMKGNPTAKASSSVWYDPEPEETQIYSKEDTTIKISEAQGLIDQLKENEDCVWTIVECQTEQASDASVVISETIRKRVDLYQRLADICNQLIQNNNKGKSLSAVSNEHKKTCLHLREMNGRDEIIRLVLSAAGGTGGDQAQGNPVVAINKELGISLDLDLTFTITMLLSLVESYQTCTDYAGESQSDLSDILTDMIIKQNKEEDKLVKYFSSKLTHSRQTKSHVKKTLKEHDLTVQIMLVMHVQERQSALHKYRQQSPPPPQSDSDTSRYRTENTDGPVPSAPPQLEPTPAEALQQTELPHATSPHQQVRWFPTNVEEHSRTEIQSETAQVGELVCLENTDAVDSVDESSLQDVTLTRILSAEEFQMRMDEADKVIHHLAGPDGGENHLERVKELLGLRGHMQDEQLRIVAMLLEDDLNMVCLSHFDESHPDVVGKLRDLRDKALELQNHTQLAALAPVMQPTLPSPVMQQTDSSESTDDAEDYINNDYAMLLVGQSMDPTDVNKLLDKHAETMQALRIQQNMFSIPSNGDDEDIKALQEWAGQSSEKDKDDTEYVEVIGVVDENNYDNNPTTKNCSDAKHLQGPEVNDIYDNNVDQVQEANDTIKLGTDSKNNMDRGRKESKPESFEAWVKLPTDPFDAVSFSLYADEKSLPVVQDRVDRHEHRHISAPPQRHTESVSEEKVENDLYESVGEDNFYEPVGEPCDNMSSMQSLRSSDSADDNDYEIFSTSQSSFIWDDFISKPYKDNSLPPKDFQPEDDLPPPPAFLTQEEDTSLPSFVVLKDSHGDKVSLPGDETDGILSIPNNFNWEKDVLIPPPMTCISGVDQYASNTSPTKNEGMPTTFIGEGSKQQVKCISRSSDVSIANTLPHVSMDDSQKGREAPTCAKKNSPSLVQQTSFTESDSEDEDLYTNLAKKYWASSSESEEDVHIYDDWVDVEKRVDKLRKADGCSTTQKEKNIKEFNSTDRELAEKLERSATNEEFSSLLSNHLSGCESNTTSQDMEMSFRDERLQDRLNKLRNVDDESDEVKDKSLAEDFDIKLSEMEYIAEEMERLDMSFQKDLTKQRHKLSKNDLLDLLSVHRQERAMLADRKRGQKEKMDFILQQKMAQRAQNKEINDNNSFSTGLSERESLSPMRCPQKKEINEAHAAEMVTSYQEQRRHIRNMKQREKQRIEDQLVLRLKKKKPDRVLSQNSTDYSDS